MPIKRYAVLSNMNTWLDLFCLMALKCLKEPPLQARGVAKVDSGVEKSANASIYLPDQVVDGNKASKRI